MNEHLRVRDLLGPYLLGALDPEEEQRVEDHLRRCAECRLEERELWWAHEHMTELAWMSEHPPPGLKTRFMDQLPQRRQRYLAPLAAAATVLVLFALAATLYASGVFGPTTVASATLRPEGPSAQAGGKVLLYDSGMNVRVKLDAWGLPPCKDGQYYELWFVKDGRRVSGGTFIVGQSGKVDANLNAPHFTGHYPKVGITYETVDRNPGASDEKILGGEIHES
ncbi:MAG: anti-sigma factor [Rubrobacteraceae bacterium]